MEREQIIKAFGCCVIGDCYPCQYRETVNCRDKMCGDALSLIKKLTEENKKLSEKIVQLISQVDCDKAEIKLLRKHIESLGTTIEMQEQELHSIKADTVRKMHSEIKERCIKGGIYPAFVASTIDQIEKEMLEKNNSLAEQT